GRSEREPMAYIFRRTGARGIRWTARVRLRGKQTTRTFQTKAAAESWARDQEGNIERDQPHQVSGRGQGALFLDAVQTFREHRATIRRPPGKTFDNALKRLVKAHGTEPIAGMGAAFWRQHSLDRMATGVTG